MLAESVPNDSVNSQSAVWGDSAIWGTRLARGLGRHFRPCVCGRRRHPFECHNNATMCAERPPVLSLQTQPYAHKRIGCGLQFGLTEPTYRLRKES